MATATQPRAKRKHVGYASNRAAVEAKAAALVDSVQHGRLEDGGPSYRFTVPSSSGDGYYEVDARGVPHPRLDNLLARAVCNCSAGLNGVRGCSHVTAVYLRWQREAAVRGPMSDPGPGLSSLERRLRTQDLPGPEQVALIVDYGRQIEALRALPTADIRERLQRYKSLPEVERSVLWQELRDREAAETERLRVLSGRPVRELGAWQEEV